MSSATGPEAKELAAFHAGETAVLSRCYQDHFDRVRAAVRGVLGEVDTETVVHDVFFQLVSSEDMRRSFTGGSMGSWLTVVARNRALDHARRYQREARALEAYGQQSEAERSFGARVEADELVRRFMNDRLRPEWRGVFEQRFLEQRSQREAAAALGIRRTTLAYQELRIRRDLKRFLLSRDLP